MEPRLGRADGSRDVLARLRASGIRTSLFLEADADAVDRARELGADRVELYTGPYAHAFGTRRGPQDSRDASRGRARSRIESGLGVNAGHDLNLANIPAYVRAVPNLAETSIGHALISDAIYIGLEKTVKAYLTALGSHRLRAPAQRLAKSQPKVRR